MLPAGISEAQSWCEGLSSYAETGDLRLRDIAC